MYVYIELYFLSNAVRYYGYCSNVTFSRFFFEISITSYAERDGATNLEATTVLSRSRSLILLHLSLNFEEMW